MIRTALAVLGLFYLAPGLLEATSPTRPCDAFLIRMLELEHNPNTNNGLRNFVIGIGRTRIADVTAQRYPQIPESLVCAGWWWNSVVDDHLRGGDFLAEKRS